MVLTPAERSLRSRIGASVLHATHDPKETTAKARETFLAKFEREVDPEGQLPEAERARRAEMARKAHFARLALKSARSRQHSGGMPRESYARTTEAQFQQTVMGLAGVLGWLCYHTFDSRRSEPGFPDVVFVRERVIYAELKTERGKVSADQEIWLAALKAAGQEVYVWRPSDMDRILEILQGEVS